MATAKVSVTAVMPADVDTVWGLIGGFNDLPRWNPRVSESRMDGEGVGAIRVLTLANGGSISERLEAEDNAGRAYRYSIVEAPLPVQNYVGRLGAEPAGPNSTTVTWSAEFDPADGVPEEKAIEIIDSMFRGGLAVMEKAIRKDG
ncbi:SRPBCC family protein [Oceanibacterium hippocampi]|uniref:Polyketide cyclase / dehydrase and lipid transport n=1 Tax=Oceanibacterium hippocampi TaxID=745714 RepID=A0A1Y5SYC4_9PROT|nr:SRPBCC family protein [Oceanibacterium hippocampi]SLN49695.1 Polyketide cyclase / dehydrase and lipid transport [Oceanibacterium hippocampi]